MPDAEGKPTALDLMNDRVIRSELRAQKAEERASRSYVLGLFGRACWFVGGALLSLAIQWI